MGLVCRTRKGVFREEASRAGRGKAVGNSVLVKDEKYWKIIVVFFIQVGYPLQVKFIQHAQAHHLLSFAHILLG